jgi:NitT/TauT family transport system ATP-binding protein
MLKIDNISVSYRIKGKKVPVLQDFSLQLDKGEVLAVLGPSGCGKSTLIQVLAGMLLTDSGMVNIDVDGAANVPLDPKIHKIAVIPQNCGLLPWKTVRQNCLLPLKLHNLKIDDKTLTELTETCRCLKVDSLLERYPRELSGGQVQRAALARAFLQKPDLLLMDEPFSSLDAITRSDAWALFLKIWTQKRPTTILVTHSMEEALYLGRKIAVLDKEKGRLLEQMDNPFFGRPDSVQEDFLFMKSRLKGLLKPMDRGEMP